MDVFGRSIHARRSLSHLWSSSLPRSAWLRRVAPRGMVDGLPTGPTGPRSWPGKPARPPDVSACAWLDESFLAR